VEPQHLYCQYLTCQTRIVFGRYVQLGMIWLEDRKVKEEMFLIYEGDHHAILYQKLEICLRKLLCKIIFFPERKILHLLPYAVDGSSNAKNEKQTGSPAYLSYSIYFYSFLKIIIRNRLYQKDHVVIQYDSINCCRKINIQY